MSEERAVYEGVRVPIRTCCPRCEQLTDAQISALLASDIRVGRVCYTALGQITPAELDHELGRREREVLVAMLQQYPQVAEFSQLGNPLPPGSGTRASVYTGLISNLREKLAPYGVGVMRKEWRGYYLVEVTG